MAAMNRRPTVEIPFGPSGAVLRATGLDVELESFNLFTLTAAVSSDARHFSRIGDAIGQRMLPDTQSYMH